MKLVNRINRRLKINRAVRELSVLNDDILRDIGIERGNIHELVEKMVDAGASRAMKVETARHEHIADTDIHARAGAAA